MKATLLREIEHFVAKVKNYNWLDKNDFELHYGRINEIKRTVKRSKKGSVIEVLFPKYMQKLARTWRVEVSDKDMKLDAVRDLLNVLEPSFLMLKNVKVRLMHLQMANNLLSKILAVVKKDKKKGSELLDEYKRVYASQDGYLLDKVTREFHKIAKTDQLGALGATYGALPVTRKDIAFVVNNVEYPLLVARKKARASGAYICVCLKRNSSVRWTVDPDAKCYKNSKRKITWTYGGFCELMSWLEHDLVRQSVELRECKNYKRFGEKIKGGIYLGDLAYYYTFANGFLDLWKYEKY